MARKMTPDPLRIAVIGVGHLGQHHARLLADMPGVDLIGVVDTKPGRAGEIAAKYGTRAFTDAADVRHLVDAVTVAVPTQSHVDVAMPFVSQGNAVLIEKPLASSVADADRLIDAAAQRGSVLAVGHTERFNPAVAAAQPGISDPRFVEVHRLGVMAQGGLVRGLYPAHSPLDGDAVFSVATGDVPLSDPVYGLSILGISAANVLARAIARGVYEAAPTPSNWSGPQAHRTVFPEAHPPAANRGRSR